MQLKGRQGFTLLECLVVVSILAVLLLLSLPLAQKLRQVSGKVKCLSNLRQLGTAGLQYSIEHRGRLPITDWYAADPMEKMWYTKVAQYVYPDHRPGESCYYPLFRCPAVDAVRKRPKVDVYRGANIDYGAIFAAPPKWLLYKPIYMQQVDGHRSSVALLMEADADGHGGPYDERTFSIIVGPALSRHGGSINIFYCDGSTRQVQNATWADLYSTSP